MKVHVLSLGCARALVDAEGLAGLLESAGHTLTGEVKEAECVVVNTCSFIQPAEEESISTILQVASLKRSGRLRRLYVTGCLPQKRRAEREDLLRLLPEVDGFLGTGDLPKLPELIGRPKRGTLQKGTHLQFRVSQNGASPSKRFFVASPVSTLLFDSAAPRRRLTPPHFAYVKISEGCDHACTFCSIPQFRGPHRSRSMEDLVEEGRRLASEGVVELNLIGQDTSYYGMDRYGRLCLPELLQRLSAVEGIHWIRILYAHPAHVTEELMRAIRDLPQVVKYLDIPIQHVSDRILAAMRRETDGRWIRRMVERLRQEIPDLALRTTLIVGFPGETEGDVEDLAAFLKEARFERLGIFPYSPEPKTPAERLPEQIPEAVKQERFDRLMTLQRGISEELNQRWLGRELEVLLDEPTLGRTYADAPEVDGQVFVHSERPLEPGGFVRARVTDAYEYDLVAEAIGAPQDTPAPGSPPAHRSICPSEAALAPASGRARLRPGRRQGHHARAAS